MAEWYLPCGGTIRRPARSHPRCRPSLRHASTRRATTVRVNSALTRTCARTGCACQPLSMLRTVTRGLAWSACSRFAAATLLLPCCYPRSRVVPVFEDGEAATRRCQRRRDALNRSTDDHPLLAGGHPDRFADVPRARAPIPSIKHGILEIPLMQGSRERIYA